MSTLDKKTVVNSVGSPTKDRSQTLHQIGKNKLEKNIFQMLSSYQNQLDQFKNRKPRPKMSIRDILTQKPIELQPQMNDYTAEQKSIISNQKVNLSNLGNKSKYFSDQKKTIRQLIQHQPHKSKQKLDPYFLQQLTDDVCVRQAFPRRRRHFRRTELSKQCLKLLAQKFDQNYSVQKSMNMRKRLSIIDISKLFKLSNTTVNKLFHDWLDDPSLTIRMHKSGYMDEPDGCTVQRLQHVQHILKDNPFLTINEITNEINKIEELKRNKDGCKQDISTNVVAQLLKRARFRKKRVRCVPIQRNTTNNIALRYQYCLKYNALLEQRDRILFLDETGFNLHLNRDKAWAKPHQEVTVNCPIKKGKRYSLMAVISDEGLAHWRIIQGTFRKHQYLEFIRQLFDRIRELEDDTPYSLILDNCTIHDHQLSLQLGKAANIKVIYLPPYSPQLNPIENWFHQIKTKIRKINYSTEKELLDIMQKTLVQYEDYDLSNYYAGVLKFVQRGLDKEKI